MYKLTVYVPESHMETVKAALFAAGAGRYRHYDRCCWQVLGTGQFRPLAGSHPFIGRENETERVVEWRVELMCEDERLPSALAALRQAHPYEEPAFDCTRVLIDPEDLPAAPAPHP